MMSVANFPNQETAQTISDENIKQPTDPTQPLNS